MSYEKLANAILEKSGGASNIKGVTYCMTRLRLTLYDDEKIDVKGIERLDHVMRVVKIAGQYQIVLGAIVEDVYNNFTKLVGFTDENITSNTMKSDKAEKVQHSFKIKDIASMAATTLASIFTPLIPAMLGSGMLKVILIIMEQGFQMNATNSSTYAVLNVLQNSFFYFMPILLAWSASKRFKVNTVMALFVVCFLVHPNLAALFAEGEVTFLGLPVTPVTYTSQVIPALLAVYLLKWVDLGLQKIIPNVIKTMTVPLLTILIVAPVTLIVLGPLGYWGGLVITNVIKSFYNFSPILSGALIGATWNLLLICGMHMVVLTLVRNQNLATFGFDKITVAYCASLMCQVSAGLAVAIRTKNKALKKKAYALTLTSFFAGNVIEPVMYGINVKYKRPFYFTIVGGLIGGAIIGASGAQVTAATGFSIYTLPAFFGPGFLGLVAGSLIGAAITFVLTYKWGLDEKDIAEYAEDAIINEDQGDSAYGTI